MKEILIVASMSMVALGVAALGTASARGFFEKLSEGDSRDGFVVTTLYLDAADQPAGARFVHKPTGFVLDVFHIQSVPQAFIWVNTLARDDRGEPHTCEHVLLGKGAKGKSISMLDDMRLGESTAYTSRLYTAYSFNCSGGEEAFFELLGKRLDALLHPDATDEEIAREVCHVGITTDQATGRQVLEEKGSVYTEMISSFEKPWSRLDREQKRMAYGPTHPVARISGGYPPDIREMTPSDLRAFHQREYHLHNMGMIVALPKQIAPREFTKRFGVILDALNDPARAGEAAAMDAPLPPPAPEPAALAGAARTVPYPNAIETEPGNVSFCWPPVRDLDLKESLMLEVFLYCLGGSETSNLYRAFIDSRTRKVDLKANRVFAWQNDDIGHAVFAAITNVDQTFINEADLGNLAALVKGEVAAVAAYPDGSPELADFNARGLNYLGQARKEAEKNLNAPPGFGLRDQGGGGWYDLLRQLERKPGFRKSLVWKDEFAWVTAELSRPGNPWRPRIASWKLAETAPFALGTKPSRALLEQETSDKKTRLDSFAAGLRGRFGVEDEQEGLRRFKVEFDRRTLDIESREAGIPVPRFLDNPPLTYDDILEYRVVELPGKVPLVQSSFDTMTSSATGVALRLDAVPYERLVYAPLLPAILTEIGVVKDGQRYDYTRMKEALKKEVLRLSSGFDVNPNTGRAELVLRADGSNSQETRNALGWMEACLFRPLLDEDNLPRIRDVVKDRLAAARNTTKGREENWVTYPALGYRFQNRPLILATECFLTQGHFLHRVKWLLMDPPSDGDREAILAFFDGLEAALPSAPANDILDAAARLGKPDTPGTPALPGFMAGFASLSEPNRAVVAEAVGDLAAVFQDFPAETAAADTAYFVRQMKADLQVPPASVLAQLRDVLETVRNPRLARMVHVSNQTAFDEIRPLLERFASHLPDRAVARQAYPDKPIVLDRMRSRYPGAQPPVYAGFVHRNTQNGVIVFSAPCAGLFDRGEAPLLDFLASKLLAGGGPQSLFMQTWGAGLAYNNGVGSNERSGRIQYYAERCPDAALTMRFVSDHARNARLEPSMGEYAIAQVFNVDRGPNGYEDRGISMAADLADGFTQEAVRHFRKRILELRSRPDLFETLRERIEPVYGKVLIGLGPAKSKVAGGSYFLVGPETQLASMEQYIASAEGKETVRRVYPRDYWIVPAEGTAAAAGVGSP